MSDPFYQFNRTQRAKSIALANMLCVIVGATLLGFAYGWQTGWGVGCVAWALIPIVE